MKRFRLFSIAALLTSGLLLTAQSVRADAIDDALGQVNGAKKILKHLQKQGYRNVGVLRFQVQRADGKPNFHAGHLNDVMATRLENALIIVQPLDEAKLIGITRGATTVAAERIKGSNYTTKEGRASLFAEKYPLAWGKKSVKVDAFVTGIVQVSPDYKTTRIVIQAFDSKNPSEVKEITTLEPNTDRAALRDMGESFVISKRSMFLFASKGVIPDSEVDNTVPDLVAKPGDNIEKIKEYLDIEIVMGDGLEGAKILNPVPMNIVADGAGHAKIDGLIPGKNLVIKMKAKTQLGVLLRVNGVNTINEERYEKNSPYEYSWWILEANKEYLVRGFAKRTEDGKATLKQFKVTPPEAVPPSDLGEDVARWGKIEFEIFADVPALGLEPKVKIAKQSTDFLRKDLPPTNSFQEAKDLIAMARSEVIDPRGRLFITGDTEKTINLESTEFNGTNVGRLEVRYYYPGK